MGTAGALGVAALVAVDSFGAPTSAQRVDAALTVIPVDGSTRNAEQRIDDSGRIVVFESTGVDAAGLEFTRVLIHDRDAGTTQPVPESGADVPEPVQTFNPAISPDGCIVTYSTFTEAVTEDGDPATDGDTAPGATIDEAVDSVPTSEVGGAEPTTVAPESSLPVEPVTPVIVSPASSELRAVDRCGAETSTPTDAGTSSDATPAMPSVLVASESVDAPLPAAALSTGGVFVAYSTGDEIVRMQGTVAGYTLTSVFDTTPVPTAESVTGPNLDIAADGSVIVFEAGVDTTPDDPTDQVDLGVHAWTTGDGPTPPSIRPIASSSSHPSLSADAEVIAFQSQVGSDSAFAGVVVQVVSEQGAVVNISIDPLGTVPDVSADGRHVVYNTTAGRPTPGLAMTSSVGDGSAPFAGVDVTDLGASVAGSPAIGAATTGPRVAALGDTVAADPTTPDVSPLVAVRSVPASVSLDQTSYDLGSADPGATLTATVVVTNQGPSSIVLGDDGVVVETPFAVTDNGCTVSVGPRGTCAVEVAVELTTLEALVGSITVTPSGGAPVTAELTARIAAPSTETATTSPANTTASSTPTTVRITPPNTTRTTTRSTTRVTTPRTTRAPVIEVDLDPIFEPPSFEFAPTILDAGSRTASLEIINPSSSTETLSSVEVVDASAGFAVTGTDCVELSVGSRCTVDLVFAPLQEGSLAAELVATFESGARASAALSGVGAPAPTVTVIPGVATVGQVVTVQGAGFPAGSTVDVTFGEGVVERAVEIDDVGVFNLPLVVLPHTQVGPLAVSVAGQEGLFGDTVTEMLVTGTTRGPLSAVLGSLGANVSR